MMRPRSQRGRKTGPVHANVPGSNGERLGVEVEKAQEGQAIGRLHKAVDGTDSSAEQDPEGDRVAKIRLSVGTGNGNDRRLGARDETTPGGDRPW